MKRKFGLMIVLLLFLSGCQLAQPEATGTGAPYNGDPLIGVYLTPDYLDLFDFEGWFEDNRNRSDGGDIIIEGDTSAYEGRLYASYDETRNRWDFEGLEGHSMFCWEQTADWGTGTVVENSGGLADSHFVTRVTDEGVENDLSATLYVQPTDIVSWYINPVYQDRDGRVYLTAGSGSSFSDHTGSAGISVTQTLSSETTTTDTGGKTETQKTSCQVTIQTRRPAELLRVVWMDARHQVLRQAEYRPEDVPPELDARDAAYLVVEQQEFGGAVTYSLAQRDAENGKSVRVFAPGDHGVLIARELPVIWEDGNGGQ